MKINYDKYQNDIQILLDKQFINGSDYWTTPDGATANGGPFSTLESCLLLADVNYDLHSTVILGAVNAIFKNQKEDGRIRTFSTGTIYPCQTANAAKTLCALGYAKDPRLSKTYQYLLESQHTDGGWRCNASKYGKGSETLFSNPGPTLTVLDVFRHTDFLNSEPALDKAVEFLLGHWETKLPLGPCHYGIGSIFMKVEFPVGRYNLLNYVFVLSFYNRAKKDPRFLEAFEALKSKESDDMLVLENANRKLKDLVSCRVNQKNEIVTSYYNRILKNLG